ncbi:MAG TPA: hypothetical protein VF224_09570 [Aestuariivirga sp.]
MPPRIITVSAVLTLFVSTQGVFAHDDWISRQKYYDPESHASCCDERDCFPLEDEDVLALGEGFEINGQYFIARQRVLPSGDGQYWACFNSDGRGPHDREKGVRCFFAPMNS